MNFKSFSNAELEESFISHVKTERKVMHLILLHIKEIEIRKLYLEKSRSSLFSYLVEDIGYSGQAAQRRIEGARLIRDIPEVSEKIAAGKIHLSHVGEFVRAAKQKESESQIKLSSCEKLELITSIENTTTAETQRILSAAMDLNLKPREIKTVQKDESVHISLTLSKNDYDLLMQCKDLASHKLLQESKSVELADVVSLALLALKEKYQVRPSSSRDKRSTPTTLDTRVASSKTLTPKRKIEIRNRYQYCQHRDSKTQKFCGSQFLLQVDHKRSRWAGGGNEDGNLTLLCAAHNRIKYRKEAGLS